MKSEKGYTGIDIAISVVVIFIFVSVIATLSYTFNSSSKEVELKAEATAIAVEEIENIKSMKFEEIENISEANGNSEYILKEEIKDEEENNTGFYRTITIQDYADIAADKTSGLVKKVTVTIQYMFKGKTQTVELSTSIAKES